MLSVRQSRGPDLEANLDVLETLRGTRSGLSADGVRSLLLFGSAARGEAGPDSDVDLLVEFEGAPSFDRYMGLRIFLEDQLGRPVDLIT